MAVRQLSLGVNPKGGRIFLQNNSLLGSVSVSE